MTRGKIVH